MKKILYAWEYGDGFGHLARAKEILTQLKLQNIRVVIASTNYEKAKIYLNDLGVEIISALQVINRAATGINRCFAELMLFNGYNHVENLANAMRNWKEIFKANQINAVIADYSPTALLAARNFRNIERFRIGTGFCCPPSDVDGFIYREQWPVSPAELRDARNQLWNNINAALKASQSTLLESWEELFKCDESFLTTFSELDHYPSMENSRLYFGPLLSSGGVEPEWKSSQQPRIFVYLKESNVLPWILDYLAKTRLNVLVFVEGVSPDYFKDYLRPTFSFSTAKLNMRQVADQCDFAITHSGHGVVVDMLLAGKPIVCMPLVIEQELLAKRLVQQGLASLGYLDNHNSMTEAISLVYHNQSYTKNAQSFAAKYANFSSEQTIHKIISRIMQNI